MRYDTIVHFVGVGGVSMTQIAKWLIKCGAKVTGSDMVFSENICDLMELGANVYLGENLGVVDEADIVVYTSSVGSNNKEVLYAKEISKPIYERSEFLGEISKNFNSVIAISGTHGKTTTTGILGNIMRESDLKFFAHIGGRCKNFQNGFYYSGDDFLLTEACEYKRHFLTLQPNILGILNIDYDHPDTYSSLDDVYDAFSKFSENVQDNGFIVLFDEIDYSKLHICKNVYILTFGLKHTSDVYADNIFESDNVCEYDIVCKGEYLHIKSKLLGIHNIYNTLASVAIAKTLNINDEVIKCGVERFLGIERRFDKVLEISGADIILDYAHHPTEIMRVIDTAKSIAKGRVFAYFQPHTYSRTSAFFLNFCDVLKDADFVGILKEFSAREMTDSGKTAFDLCYHYNNEIGQAKYFDNILDVAKDILESVRIGDIVLLLGAGDIDKVVKIIKNSK